MFRSILAAVIASAATAAADEPLMGEGAVTVPIFDAHIHYKEPAWNVYEPEDILGLMDKTGVAIGLVSSTPDEGTIMLYDHAPSRIVPELRPYHGDWGSSDWHEFPGMADYLADRLKIHDHEGIGEFHIRSRAMWDEDLYRKIIKMAKARDIHLHVHSGTEPIRWLYDLDPEVKIIWAHAGLGEHIDDVYDLLDDYPDLLADTSLREYEIMGLGDGLDPEWERLILDFQDRLMMGSDTWVNSQWDSYARIIASNRRILAELPKSVAEKLAYKNAERVFGRKVTPDLIGTR